MSATDANHSRDTVLAVRRAAQGFVIRVAGRGSLRESPGLKAFVRHAVERLPDAEFTIDLDSCEHLDSTFLGCLVGLHNTLNTEEAGRLRVAGADENLQRLFGASGVDRILPRGSLPGDAGEPWISVASDSLGRNELGWHLWECHRRLADIGGPEAEAYAGVADQIERELPPTRR